MTLETVIGAPCKYLLGSGGALLVAAMVLGLATWRQWRRPLRRSSFFVQPRRQAVFVRPPVMTAERWLVADILATAMGVATAVSLLLVEALRRLDRFAVSHVVVLVVSTGLFIEMLMTMALTRSFGRALRLAFCFLALAAVFEAAAFQPGVGGSQFKDVAFLSGVLLFVSLGILVATGLDWLWSRYEHRRGLE